MSLVRERGHLERLGGFVHADPHRDQELVAQDFAGMDKWKTTPGRYLREVHDASVVAETS